MKTNNSAAVNQWVTYFVELRKFSVTFFKKLQCEEPLHKEMTVEKSFYPDVPLSKSSPLSSEIKFFLEAKKKLNDAHTAAKQLSNSVQQYQWPYSGIAVMGDMKAGKSTLGNAIIGSPVFPARVLACTSRITILKVGCKKQYTIVNPDGRSEAPQPFKVTLPLAVVALSEDQNRSLETLKEVIVEIPHSEVSDILLPGFDYIDMPGLNESDPLDALIMKKLDTVSGILYLLSATSGGVKQYDSKALNALLKSGIQHRKPIMLVVNKIDEIEDAGQDQEGQEDMETILEMFYKSLQRVVPSLLSRYPKRSECPFWAEISALKSFRSRRHDGKRVSDPKYDKYFDIFLQKIKETIYSSLAFVILRATDEILTPWDMSIDLEVSQGELELGSFACRKFVDNLECRKEVLLGEISQLIVDASTSTLASSDSLIAAIIQRAEIQKDIESWKHCLENVTEQVYMEALTNKIKIMWKSYLLALFTPINKYLPLTDTLIDRLSEDSSRKPYFSSILITICIWSTVGIPVVIMVNQLRETLFTYDKSWKESYIRSLIKTINPAAEGKRLAKEVTTLLIKNTKCLIEMRVNQFQSIKETRDSHRICPISCAVNHSFLCRAYSQTFAYGLPALSTKIHTDSVGETFEATWRTVKVHVKRLPSEGNMVNRIFLHIYQKHLQNDPTFGITVSSDGSSFLVIGSPRLIQQLNTTGFDMRLTDISHDIPAVEGLPRIVELSESQLMLMVQQCKAKVIDENLITCALSAGALSLYLTVDEAAAILLYSMEISLYLCFNAALRTPERTLATLKPWLPFGKLFLTALKKLKPVTGCTLYRGLGKLPVSYLDKFSPTRKTPICWFGFSSVTPDKNTALKFATQEGKGMLIEIGNAQAHPINLFSWFVSEVEAILLPGSYFTAVSLEETPLYISAKLQFHHQEGIL
eukprot:TRINITY_DN219_c0_g1_i9.p1 TRINITY_DN219_c0_g1~~TRINITY_DN219_c0_g1_i9.p1  ORF type:complete len:926 (+),score=147.56 TRINITY_DN219_c0_g1_i9:413-3190(+)